MAADDQPQSPSHDRAQAARAALVPLAPGERPWPIVACALLAFALGSLTLVFYLAHVTVDGSRPTLTVVVVYVCLMFGLCINVWRMRYWAVMAFQALLALAIFGFAIATIRVTDVLWLVICVAVIAGGGLLFWKLVRVIGRIQVSDRAPS